MAANAAPISPAVESTRSTAFLFCSGVALPWCPFMFVFPTREKMRQLLPAALAAALGVALAAALWAALAAAQSSYAAGPSSCAGGQGDP